MINVVKILKLSACTVETDLCWKERTFLDSGNKNFKVFYHCLGHKEVTTLLQRMNHKQHCSYYHKGTVCCCSVGQHCIAASKIYQFFKTLSLRSVAMTDNATVRLLVNVRYVPYVMRTLSNWNVLHMVVLNFFFFTKYDCVMITFY